MATNDRKRPAKECDVKFYVTWNQLQRAFDIRRDGIPTGGLSPDKKGAIELAITYAKRVTAEGNTACVYAYSQDGNRVVEWNSSYAS